MIPEKKVAELFVKVKGVSEESNYFMDLSIQLTIIFSYYKNN